jgi:hypothetical protein
VVIAGLIDVLPAEWRQMQRRCNCGVKSGFVWLCFMAMPGLTRVSISEKSLKALLLSEAGSREAGAAKLHFGDTGMRGYDFPAVGKFLEIHSAIFPPFSAWNSQKRPTTR